MTDSMDRHTKAIKILLIESITNSFIQNHFEYSSLLHCGKGQDPMDTTSIASCLCTLEGLFLAVARSVLRQSDYILTKSF